MEDNGDPYNATSAAYVGSAAAAAEEAEEAEETARESHDSLYRSRLKGLAKIVDEKQKARDLAQAAWTVAKAELQAAHDDLHKAAKDDEEYLPFAHPDEGDEGDGDVCEAPAQAQEDDSWRKVPLSEALQGLSRGIFDSLAKNDPPLLTVGDLADWTRERAVTDVEGIGPGKGQKVEDAMMAFWERRKAEQDARPVAQQELLPADPWQGLPPGLNGPAVSEHQVSGEGEWVVEGEARMADDGRTDAPAADAFALSSTPQKDTSPYAAGY